MGHGQCFRPCIDNGTQGLGCDKDFPACKGNASVFLQTLLDGKFSDGELLDFAGVEQFVDQEVLARSLDLDAWAKIQHACGKWWGTLPNDLVTLFYNVHRWKTLNGTHTYRAGCMEMNGETVADAYRGFLVQGFESKHTGSKVI